MAKLNIVFFETSKEEIDFFKSQLKGHKLTFFKEKIQDVNKEEYKRADVVSVFIYSKLSDKILALIPNLKAVITRSTGFDHINLDYCKHKKIEVSNVPFYGDNTVAEHAFAMLLNLSRNIHKSYIRGKTGNYSIEGLKGFDLMGKTIGIIGVGHIGMHMIRMSKGFGMKVLAYDLHQENFMADFLGFEYKELDYILKNSDVISLHMPYNSKTHHFINSNKMKKMKKGVILINTARGGLIDTKSLYEFLKSGQIAGCGLDVIEGEEFIMHEDELLHDLKNNRKKIYNLTLDKQIFAMENVIFTPHNAFNSKEALHRIWRTSLENIVNYEKTGKVKSSVIK